MQKKLVYTHGDNFNYIFFVTCEHQTFYVYFCQISMVFQFNLIRVVNQYQFLSFKTSETSAIIERVTTAIPSEYC